MQITMTCKFNTFIMRTIIYNSWYDDRFKILCEIATPLDIHNNFQYPRLQYRPKNYIQPLIIGYSIHDYLIQNLISTTHCRLADYASINSFPEFYNHTIFLKVGSLISSWDYFEVKKITSHQLSCWPHFGSRGYRHLTQSFSHCIEERKYYWTFGLLELNI